MSSILLLHEKGGVRDTLGAALAAAGHRVTPADDGEAAVGAFREIPPDLVLLDRRLPGGLAACGRLRALAPEADILVLTSLADAEGQEKFLAFGVRAFLPKEPTTLLKVLDRLSRRDGRVRAEGHRFTPRVLVIDDDPNVRSLLRRFLENRGYEVRAAAGGMEGLTLLRESRPHVVLLDFDMPDLNGLETLRRIKALDAASSVLMITANGDERTARLCLQEGASDYIMKPFDLDYLELSVYAKVLLLTL